MNEWYKERVTERERERDYFFPDGDGFEDVNDDGKKISLYFIIRFHIHFK